LWLSAIERYIPFHVLCARAPDEKGGNVVVVVVSRRRNKRFGRSR
jgi:hypothetical protein